MLGPLLAGESDSIVTGGLPREKRTFRDDVSESCELPRARTVAKCFSIQIGADIKLE